MADQGQQDKVGAGERSSAAPAGQHDHPAGPSDRAVSRHRVALGNRTAIFHRRRPGSGSQRADARRHPADRSGGRGSEAGATAPGRNRRASSPLRHRGRRHASCDRARHAALSRDRVSSRLSVLGGAGRGNRRRRSHDGRDRRARQPGSKPGSRSYPAAAERPRGSGRRDRESGFGIRACRFHCRHHRCEALGEAGGAGDDRHQGAPRQGAGAACATHRSA